MSENIDLDMTKELLDNKAILFPGTVPEDTTPLPPTKENLRAALEKKKHVTKKHYHASSNIEFTIGPMSSRAYAALRDVGIFDPNGKKATSNAEDDVESNIIYLTQGIEEPTIDRQMALAILSAPGWGPDNLRLINEIKELNPSGEEQVNNFVFLMGAVRLLLVQWLIEKETGLVDSHYDDMNLRTDLRDKLDRVTSMFAMLFNAKDTANVWSVPLEKKALQKSNVLEDKEKKTLMTLLTKIKNEIRKESKIVHQATRITLTAQTISPEGYSELERMNSYIPLSSDDSVINEVEKDVTYLAYGIKEFEEDKELARSYIETEEYGNSNQLLLLEIRGLNPEPVKRYEDLVLTLLFNTFETKLLLTAKNNGMLKDIILDLTDTNDLITALGYCGLLLDIINSIEHEAEVRHNNFFFVLGIKAKQILKKRGIADRDLRGLPDEDGSLPPPLPPTIDIKEKISKRDNETSD